MAIFRGAEFGHLPAAVANRCLISSFPGLLRLSAPALAVSLAIAQLYVRCELPYDPFPAKRGTSTGRGSLLSRDSAAVRQLAHAASAVAASPLVSMARSPPVRATQAFCILE